MRLLFQRRTVDRRRRGELRIVDELRLELRFLGAGRLQRRFELWVLLRKRRLQLRIELRL
jgi:hypothetical protein